MAVITADDIARSTSNSIVDLLARAADVNLRSFFGHDKFAGVDIRGMGDTFTSNVLVLIDGVRLNEIDLSGADFAAPTAIDGAWFTNTTYTALAMRDGDNFSKQFGGPDGTDPDWFLLTITGLDASDTAIGTVDFYLADFRFDDSADDFIVDTWVFVALDSLGVVAALEFALSSSDIGAFGINTPTYFALDHVQPVPLPGALWLFAPVALSLLRTRRRS